MNKDELGRLVQTCWEVACNVPMSSVDPGIYRGYDPQGNPQMNLIRWTTYQLLLANLLPKNNTVEQTVPKERWQDD